MLMYQRVAEPVKDFREVFKDYDSCEIERITEILGALAITEGDVESWQQDVSRNTIDPHRIYGMIPNIGAIKIGTNPSFPESVYVEVFSLNSVRNDVPNLIWYRGRMIDSTTHIDEGAVLFPYEYIGASLRPIVHFDAEQLSTKIKPVIANNHRLKPILMPKELENITSQSAGEVFFGVARKILYKE